MAVEASSQPMPEARYNLVLREIQSARLKELQAAHDSLLYEARQLKQKQQSGTQQHLVVSEKRRLASLIGKTHTERKRVINMMAPFVRYIIDNTEHHNIPADWKMRAREGTPYWCQPEVEFVGTAPSISEKNIIVESYLKRQRAWEQVTEVLPRETVDAMRFFGDIEKRASAFINCQPSQNETGAINRETSQYHLGCLTLCQDIFVKARECRLKCHDVWNTIEAKLQSDQVIKVTTVTGEGGDISANLRVHATLPLLQPLQAASAELLSQDHLTVPDSLAEDMSRLEEQPYSTRQFGRGHELFGGATSRLHTG
jgi:hypothetical protein